MSGLALRQRIDPGNVDADPPNGDVDQSTVRPDRPRAKWAAAILSVTMIVAVLVPIGENWRRSPRDNFPLSYYPMFSLERGQTSRVTYVMGFDAQRNRIPIPYTLIGAGGMNQVRRQLTKTVRQGEADKFCRSVQSKVAARKTGPIARVVSLDVTTGTYNLTGFFSGNRAPESEQVHATCQVRRSNA